MVRRVLVADDEPLTAEMLALMLAFRGFEVVCAHDGAEALQQARSGSRTSFCWMS
jgi:CheY-like chemotaxis protein